MKIFQLFVLITLFVINSFAQENKKFHNILLIINYNHAHYESIPLIKKIYSNCFDTIVFYGPQKHPAVNFYQHTMGYTSYMCIADAMKKYKDFDGYLFLMDDCILSTWLLESFDSSKMWFGDLAWINNHSRGLPVDLTKGQNQLNSWEWWASRWGYSRVVQAFKEIPKNYKKTLAENSGKSHVVVGFSDVAYIPAHYKDGFIELANIFGKYDVFLEIALPTIMNCLSSKDSWFWLKGNSTFSHGYQDFKKEVHVNHPIKLSYQVNRTFVETLFSK